MIIYIYICCNGWSGLVANGLNLKQDRWSWSTLDHIIFEKSLAKKKRPFSEEEHE